MRRLFVIRRCLWPPHPGPLSHGEGAGVRGPRARLPLPLALLLVPFSVVGSFLGANAVLEIEPSIIKSLIIAVMAAMTLYVLFRKTFGRENRFEGLTSGPAAASAALALAIGFYDGFLGPGTGSFLLFAFVGVQGFDFVRAAGHVVYTPTLTGLGERSHLLSGEIDFQTHVKDIVNVFLWEDLRQVVLVGHSYAGWVITQAVEEIEDRVRAIVYLDAFLPDHGDRGYDFLNEQKKAAFDEARERIVLFGMEDPVAESDALTMLVVEHPALAKVLSAVPYSRNS